MTKQQYFAQYYGQNVLRLFDNSSTFIIKGYNISHLTTEDYLELRSIEQLTDDEIKNIANMYGWGSKDVPKDRYNERLLQFKIDIPCITLPGYAHRHLKFVFDYLTRIGVLLPFTYLDENNIPVTLSNEEIIALGWAKIKE